MSANLTEIALIGPLNELLNLQSSNQIGGIQIDTTIEEFYEDVLEVTEHPVQRGAQIADHSFKRPMEIILTCGWSNSSPSGFLGSFGAAALASFSPGLAGLVGVAAGVSNLFNPGAGTSGSFSGGAMAASDYVAGIYSQLLQMQEARQPVAVAAGLRTYNNMLIASLRVRRDEKMRFTLVVQAQLREIILVDTQTTTLPPQGAQANPASTADVVNAGPQQLQPQPTISPLIAVLPPVQGITGSLGH